MQLVSRVILQLDELQLDDDERVVLYQLLYSYPMMCSFNRLLASTGLDTYTLCKALDSLIHLDLIEKNESLNIPMYRTVQCIGNDFLIS
jgi:hypothetical protein